MRETLVLRLVTPAFAALVSLAAAAEAPVELGAVRWARDLEGGLKAAKAEGKPVLLLFNEVPG
ncbi:MAG: thioredoxin family protein [Planctomycetes bacterium]|jgi:hypothetical protein|nr:thioredoxin family protein [Planctomycetota bacterium]